MNDYLLYLFATLYVLAMFYLLFNNYRLNKIQKEIKAINDKNVNGFIYLNRETYLNSEYFKCVSNNAELHKLQASVEFLNEFLTYPDIEYQYRILVERHQLNLDEGVSDVFNDLVSAACILFNKPVHPDIYSQSVGVAINCHLYLVQTRPVSFMDEMQKYIDNQYEYVDSEDIAKSHKDIKYILDHVSAISKLIAELYTDYKIHIEYNYLKRMWLRRIQKHTHVYNYYNGNENNFKILLTLFAGITKTDVPISYLQFNPAVVDYVCRTKRYSRHGIRPVS